MQFVSLGILVQQMGRQYIPVEETPTKNRPSNRLSLALNAEYKTSSCSINTHRGYMTSMNAKSLAIFGHDTMINDRSPYLMTEKLIFK